ncbi:efflux RND transporter periplasmic adaptor subunit [Duganella sp. FT134W]|uniref:Efflux RND transporter periplasmic adaptor subunit n=1 Tax=Duganella margarita TaxID=2692170 RepID=A0A7X4GXF0_9BURK|nr:efflux RND transporter periplasmic adaptor subunit [Duganella margarita]
MLIAVGAGLLAVLVGWFTRPGGKADAAAVTAPAALTVNVTEPARQTWPDTIEVDGSLAAWQEAVIGAETGNLRITALYADVGSTVKRGQLLARLADGSAVADVRKQEGAVAQARASVEKAQADLQRSRVAADSGALSGQKIDEYRTAAANGRASLDSALADLQSKRITLEQTRIVAVDDGIVSSRSALLGNVVNTGAELFRLVRQGRVEWQAELDAQQLARVRVGQQALVKLPSGSVITGVVRLAAPTLSTNTGRAIVYVSLTAGRGAQSGMFASGSIELAQTTALTLPESALVVRDGRVYVYVLSADGAKVARRTVLTGRRRDGRVEVLSGVDATARVVVSGGAFLSDGVAVRVVAATPAVRKATS